MHPRAFGWVSRRGRSWLGPSEQGAGNIGRLLNKFARPDRGVAVYDKFANIMAKTPDQTKRWRPIVYLKRHHEHRDIWPFYRHADFSMVTSLHDGMNLVAKEFISVRDDNDGVLILSQFTGASSELRDALLVNPYDLDGMAEAIRAAVEMPPEERRARMARMRQAVREHNIYRWAGLLLEELTRLSGDRADLVGT